jgi:flagellar biosynthesis/type III secretory pathway M-ring protein FliF/YscJ
MSEILEVVSTIFIAVILFAGAVLIGMVAITALGLLWKELRTTFKRRRTEELPREKQGSDQANGLK